MTCPSSVVVAAAVAAMLLVTACEQAGHGDPTESGEAMPATEPTAHGGATQPQHTNRLVHETSPYLLQHAYNPVNWYPCAAICVYRQQVTV